MTVLSIDQTAEQVLAVVGPILVAAVPVSAPFVTLAGAELGALQALVTWLSAHQGPSPAQTAFDAVEAALDAQDKVAP
jgi:hypothetical protein